jgi:ubiquinol-cytochrome c reductase cytochrome c1 subunit
MREFKILGIIVFFTVVLYIGVEPFAHSQMHPHVKPADFTFKDVDGLGGITGDATKGAELVSANCTACHSITKAGFPPVMDNASSAGAYGVVPPDLSTAGYIYDANYLAAFIKNPAKAAKVEHKMVDGKMHPMPSYNWMKPEEIANMVAYLKSIAPKELTNKEAFSDACQRCHSIKYGDFYGGSMKAFSDVSKYMGTTPPDLSQYIRSRGEHYLHEFINDPQKHLQGTSMPRVGLTKEIQEQVITYMEEVGESKKHEREALGPKFLIYLTIFAIFAFLWKIKVWKDVH